MGPSIVIKGTGLRSDQFLSPADDGAKWSIPWDNQFTEATTVFVSGRWLITTCHDSSVVLMRQGFTRNLIRSNVRSARSECFQFLQHMFFNIPAIEKVYEWVSARDLSENERVDECHKEVRPDRGASRRVQVKVQFQDTRLGARRGVKI